MSDERPLSLEDLVTWAQARSLYLYEGVEVAHRSCGITLAETFGRATQPYQALRRGGITGRGHCGAMKAGELILGEVFGDPNPSAPVTPALRKAINRYHELWEAEADLGNSPSLICNDLTSQFATFKSPERRAFCTNLASTASGCVARTMLELGAEFPLTPPPSE